MISVAQKLDSGKYDEKALMTVFKWERVQELLDTEHFFNTSHNARGTIPELKKLHAYINSV